MSQDQKPIDRLLDVMRRLRDPDSGCPWDLEQDFSTIAPYTIEEAYEVSDAISRNDMDDLCDELGDLLLQVVFHAQMADEQNLFDFDDVATRIVHKMVNRHPHVFADTNVDGSRAVLKRWEEIKDEEKKEKAARKKAMTGQEANESTSILDDVPVGMPALLRAVKLQKKAAKVGFDWPNVTEVLDKLVEEIGELKDEIAKGDAARIKDEFGDVLFVLANFARKTDIDPEDALRGTNDKFVRRFKWLEREISRQKPLAESSLEEMEDYWQRAKKEA